MYVFSPAHSAHHSAKIKLEIQQRCRLKEEEQLTPTSFARRNALAKRAAIRLMLPTRRPLFFQNEEEKHVEIISELTVLGEPFFGRIHTSSEEKKFGKLRTTL